ncbi:MAG: DUF192 domain-containing protein [Candidatus Nanohaloarchaea archaeon]|nr:DUF192 domain-containing protein [Candidatus Nanohaloarchaea archaeon]
MRKLLTAAALVPVAASALVLILSHGDAATVKAGGHTLQVVVADTPGERRKGLMNRSSVPCDGMLFVFPGEAPRTFWMKHTRIPLDIVFLTSEGRVLNVEHADPPDGGEPELYRSDGDSMYVLEIPRGYAARYGIAEGEDLEVEGEGI